MFDLIVRNATLPDGRTLDIGIRDGRIAALERALAGEAGRSIDAQGLLVCRRLSIFTFTWTRRSRWGCRG